MAGPVDLAAFNHQEEAFRVSDRVVILGKGKVAQIGTPQEIYYHPSSPYVAKFLGMDNFLSGEALKTPEGSLVKTKLGEWHTRYDWEGEGLVLLRPDRIHLQDQKSEGLPSLEGVVLSSRFSGSALQVELMVDQTRFLFFSTDSRAPQPDVGETLKVSFNPDLAVHFFPDQIK